MGALTITLMGPPQLWHEERPLACPSRKFTLLLSYLLLEPGRHHREELSGLFWPDSEPQVARSALRTVLSQLRRLLPDRLRVDGALVDLQLLVHDTVDVRCEGPAPSDLPFLQGVEVREEGELQDWLRAMRTHLQVQQRNRLQRQVYQLEESGKLEEALSVAERCFALDGTDEAATWTLMKLHYRLGNALQLQATCEQHRHALAQQVEAEPSSEIQSLLAQLQAGLAQAELVPRESALPHTQTPLQDAFYRFPALPVRTTSFVGRQAELTLLQRLLADGARLLTLQGIGGIGKTQLALELAAILTRTYSDRVAVVPLETLQEPQEIPKAILMALGQDVQGQRQPIQQLIELLNVRPSVLILDNFEHLMDGTELVETLLNACAELKLVVTSREVLNLQQEHRVPVFGLQQDLPPHDPALPSGQVLLPEAVQLWMQRARQVRPDFELNTVTRPHIEQLCRLVGGAPLGIELAASWLKVLSIEELAHDLSLDLDLAASTARNVPARQQSLRRVFEYSWTRLNLQEQRALAGLSVFRGGFTREAAREVVRVSIQLLSRLVDASLLMVDASGRFDRHPLVYQYTQEKLEASGDAEHFRVRHAEYFVWLAAEAYPHMWNQFGDRWLDRLDLEQQNLDLTLEHLKRSGERQALLGLCADLAWFWASRSHAVAGRRVLHDAICSAQNAVGTLEYVRAQCMLCVSIADIWIPTEEEQIWLRSGIEGCRRWGDQRTLALGLRTLAFLSDTPPEEAQQLVKEARQLSERLNDPTGIISAINTQGILARRAQQPGVAQKYFEQCLSMAERLQVPYISAHYNLGLLLEQRDFERAIPHLEEGMNVFRRRKDWGALGRTMIMLSGAYMGLGQLDAAKQLLRQSLNYFRSVGHRVYVVAGLLNLVALALEEDDLAEAERLMQDVPQDVDEELYGLERVKVFQGLIQRRRNQPDLALQNYLRVLSQPWNPFTSFAIRIAWEEYLAMPLEDVPLEDRARLLGVLPIIQAEVGVFFTPRHRMDLDAGHVYTAQRVREALGGASFDRLLQAGQQLSLTEAQALIQRHATEQLKAVEPA